ncbi:carbohydrate binding family 9 domain-containing protein, partial [bacterium]|nr:carbohydrate binding family 9 domain-containing protein [bacterium]
MNNTKRFRAFDFVFLLLSACIYVITSTGIGASVGSEKVPTRVPRVNSHVKIDGVLNDDIWQNAAVMELEYEIQPGENIPALVKTEMLLAYDENHLYAGFRCYDPDPSQIRARICDRDHLSGDDWVGLNLDTFNDERRSFLFLCNPYGVQSDGIESQTGGGTWDAI